MYFCKDRKICPEFHTIFQDIQKSHASVEKHVQSWRTVTSVLRNYYKSIGIETVLAGQIAWW